MDRFSQLLGVGPRRLLVVVVVTVTSLGYGGAALTYFMTLRSEVREIILRVNEVLDHPAIRPLA